MFIIDLIIGFLKKLVASILDFFINKIIKKERIQYFLKKIGFKKNLSDLSERYDETLVELRLENKPKEILNFFRDEDIKEIFYDFYYASTDSGLRNNEDEFYSRLRHKVDALKIGEDLKKLGVNINDEITHFKKIFEQKIHESRTVSETEFFELIEQIRKTTKSNSEFLEVLKQIGIKTIVNQNGEKIYNIDNIDNGDFQEIIRKVKSKIDSSQNFSNFQIKREDFDPAIGVKDIAHVLADLLLDLPDIKGKMVGIFGQWGRGKTFLWHEIVKYLDTKDNKPIIPIEFQAWKYQDTQSSWGYLYETFADKYYDKPKEFCNFKNWKEFCNFKSWKEFCNFKSWIKYYFRIIKLNVKRKGIIPLFYFIILILITIFFSYIFKNLYSKEFISETLKNFGVLLSFSATITAFIKYLKTKFSTKAKNLFENYTSKHSFKNLLGVQAEIEKEFITLLKVWINPKKTNTKLALFVDDIDRCDESKIIETIDALRTVLDNKDIAERLIIITAIDERILKRVIKQKYLSSIKNDLTLEDEDKKNQLELLTREYFDKLFLIGFKLGNLTKTEKIEILETITKGKVYKKVNNLNKKVNNTEETTIKSPNGGNNEKEKKSVKKNGDIVKQPDDLPQIEEKKYEIEEFELNFLINALKTSSNVTPRNIIIYYNRYLLARKLFNVKHIKNEKLIQKWNELSNNRNILPKMIIYYSNTVTVDRISTDMAKIMSQNNEIIEYKLENEIYKINKELLYELFRLIEIVVPY